jgi:DeoR family transcriptional regulator of aga operon
VSKPAIDERRGMIRELVERQGRVGVTQLATRFGVSTVSIRNDLNALDGLGAIVRSRGGALALRDGEDLHLTVKQNLHRTQKVRIAEAAARLIQDGETIILDSGSTTAEIAKQIRATTLRSINVITNALNVAQLLVDAPQVNLIMLGGVLRSRSFSLAGPQAERALDGLCADRLFLGVDSIDPEIGLMTQHLQEAQLNVRMMAVSRQVVAVADASKLMRRSLSVIARAEQIDMLITDHSARPESVAAFQKKGIQVLLA